MFYNSDVVVTNGSILFSKFDGIVKYLFSYRWVKIFDVKLDECGVFLTLDVLDIVISIVGFRFSLLWLEFVESLTI